MRKLEIAKRVDAGLLRLLAVGSLAAALASATLISVGACSVCVERVENVACPCWRPVQGPSDSG